MGRLLYNANAALWRWSRTHVLGDLFWLGLIWLSMVLASVAGHFHNSQLDVGCMLAAVILLLLLLFSVLAAPPRQKKKRLPTR